jgi:hypothetical protein
VRGKRFIDDGVYQERRWWSDAGGTFGSLGITVIHGHMPTMSIQ